MADKHKDIFELLGGEVRVFEEQETIHLRAVDKHGDPVELTVDDAKRLAQHLLVLADRLMD